MSSDPPRAEIRMDRIPVGRGIAALLVILVLLGVMFLALPGIRLVAVAGLVGGGILGAILILFRGRSRGAGGV